MCLSFMKTMAHAVMALAVPAHKNSQQHRERMDTKYQIQTLHLVTKKSLPGK